MRGYHADRTRLRLGCGGLPKRFVRRLKFRDCLGTLAGVSALVVCVQFGAVRPADAQTTVAAPVVINDTALFPVDSTLNAVGALPFAVAARVPADRLSRLDTLSTRNVPLWVVVDAPESLSDVESWRRSLQELLKRYSTRITAVEVDLAEQPADLAAFAVRLASTETRAFDTSSRVAVGGVRMRSAAARGDVYTRDLAPYIDLLVVSADEADAAATWLTGWIPRRAWRRWFRIRLRAVRTPVESWRACCASPAVRSRPPCFPVRTRSRRL